MKPGGCLITNVGTIERSSSIMCLLQKIRSKKIMETIALISSTVALFILEFIGYMLVLAIADIFIGISMGYTFTSFSFAGFMIRNDNKRLSVTTTPMRFIAETLLYRKEMTGKIKILNMTIQCIVMTLLSGITAYAFVCFGVVDNPYTKFMNINLGIIWIIHILVYISYLKKAFSKGHEHYLWEQEIITFNKIKNDVRPGDIPLIDVELSEKSPLAKKCILLNYYRLLDGEEYDLLPPYIETFENIIGNVNNIIASDVPYAYEIVYYYSVINENLVKAEHYAGLLGNLLINDMDMNGRRVYAAYLLGTNKSKESVMTVIKQGLTDDNRTSGQVIKRMEAELLTKLKEKLYAVD